MFLARSLKLYRLKNNLIGAHALVFQALGMCPREALAVSRATVKRAEVASRRKGTWTLPEGYGDFLLNNWESSEPLREYLEHLRAEGVRDDDVRWWWNMHDLERNTITELDGTAKYVAYSAEYKRLGNMSLAIESVRRHCTIYGAEQLPDLAPIDQPLPQELRYRSNLFTVEAERYGIRLSKRASAFSSMNAFVRSEIRSGRI